MSPLVRTCCVGEGTCHHWLGPVVGGGYMSPLVRTCCVGEGTCHHWLGPVVWGRVHVTIG